MQKQNNLEVYKSKVKNCLLTIYNCSTQETERLMKLYEDDFPEALNQFSWPPETMALAMTKGY